MKYLKYYDSSAEYDSNFGNDYVEPFLGYVNGESLVLYNKIKYVDLGLPSGILWGTMNIGATSEMDLGYKFLWGETVPYTDYNSHTYKWGTSPPFSKYNPTDKKAKLDDIDDAVKLYLGDDWRIPTYNDGHELVVNCTTTITSDRVIYTSKTNGNSIVFPLPYCNVWLSELNTTYNSLYRSAYFLGRDSESNKYYYGVDTRDRAAINIGLRGVKYK